MGYIYKICENDTSVYIGQTIKTIEQRWAEHLNTAKRKNNNVGFLLHNKMRAHGIENFSISLVEETENLNEREKYWIQYYNTYVDQGGYNLTLGGEQCSDSLKIPCYQYDLNGKFIKEYSSISEAARAMNGQHTNILSVLQNKTYTAYGFRWSLKKTEKLEFLKTNYTGVNKIIFQYDLQGNFIQSYESSKAAARALGKSQGNISSAATGKRKSAYGFLWSYDYIIKKAYG